MVFIRLGDKRCGLTQRATQVQLEIFINPKKAFFAFFSHRSLPWKIFD